jgi:hypothetical protein
MRGKADRLNCTGHRHYRCAGQPHILWRDNEAYVGSLCLECDDAPVVGQMGPGVMRSELVGLEVLH